MNGYPDGELADEQARHVARRREAVERLRRIEAGKRAREKMTQMHEDYGYEHAFTARIAVPTIQGNLTRDNERWAACVRAEIALIDERLAGQAPLDRTWVVLMALPGALRAFDAGAIPPAGEPPKLKA